MRHRRQSCELAHIGTIVKTSVVNSDKKKHTDLLFIMYPGDGDWEIEGMDNKCICDRRVHHVSHQ
jgi:hypothetical protein